MMINRIPFRNRNGEILSIEITVPKKLPSAFQSGAFPVSAGMKLKKSNMFCRFDVPYLIKYHIRQSRRFYFVPSMVRLYTDRLIFL